MSKTPQEMNETADLEAMAQRLRDSGRYRVLRRLEPRPVSDDISHQDLSCAIVIDVETTGLHLPGSGAPVTSEVISLAMVPILYRADTGEIVGHLPSFHRYRQPSHPIPAEITLLTGIDDARVAGCRIDAADIASFLATTTVRAPGVADVEQHARVARTLVIAHNAAFDRRMVEGHWREIYAPLPWACSQTQVAWAEHGFEGTKLAYLAGHAGLFYERHDALDDCHAVVALLGQVLQDGRTAMAHLYEDARRPTHRLFAAGAAYDLRHALKARQYKWSNGDDGRLRAWYRDAKTEAELAAELAFLEKEVLGPGATPPVIRFTALDRFSDRC